MMTLMFPGEPNGGTLPTPEQRAVALQNSVAPDLYTTATFIPWEAIERILNSYQESIETLQAIVDTKQLTRTSLSEWLRIDTSLWVARALFAAPQPVGFSDGRQLPETVPETDEGLRRLAELLIDLGVNRLVPFGTRVVDVVRIGEIGLDARRRGFRRRDGVTKSLTSLVQKAVDEASETTGRAFELLPTSKWPPAARNRATVVVGVDGLPIVAVANVFQAQTGGRQSRDLVETYPTLQRELDSSSVSLVVLADGRGIQQSPRRVLIALIEQVAACMSTRDAETGELTAVLIDAAKRSGLRRGAVRGLEAIIASSLENADIVYASDLPGPRDQSLLAMGAFVAKFEDLALKLDASDDSLAWISPEAQTSPRALLAEYDPARAVKSLATLLNLRDLKWLPDDDDIVGAFGTLNDPILPSRMLIAAADPTIRNIDVDLLKRVGLLNRTRDNGGRLALLAAPSGFPAAVTSTQQRTLATSVVVVDTQTLLRAAQDKSPRRVLLDLVLRQADLTKANPFTVMGVADSSIFHGRGNEDAMLQNTLQTNSAALIGGRRIGKTSLLQHARARLIDAGVNVKYADCQAIDSWTALAQHAALHWQVSVNEQFSANAVEELIAQLQVGHAGQLVIMLDEVDNLLRWDREPSAHEMSETFFRALRSLSQEGSCQFVFSGERLIANVLWDPGSPHWNFCRAIPVRQLTREDAGSLFANPISALGVEVSEPADSLAEVWLATSGHPQIVQQLGEFVVSSLNERPSSLRGTLSVQNIRDVAASAEFKRHYVRTYWGQATPIEKLITALIIEGASTIDEIMSAAASLGVAMTLDGLQSGLQMLDLYGILDIDGTTIAWRATRFATALEAMGGAALTVKDCVRTLT